MFYLFLIYARLEYSTHFPKPSVLAGNNALYWSSIFRFPISLINCDSARWTVNLSFSLSYISNIRYVTVKDELSKDCKQRTDSMHSSWYVLKGTIPTGEIHKSSGHKQGLPKYKHYENNKQQTAIISKNSAHILSKTQSALLNHITYNLFIEKSSRDKDKKILSLTKQNECGEWR
jgi:hypothetical protein